MGIEITNFILANWRMTLGPANVNNSFTATITYQQDPMYHWYNTTTGQFVTIFFACWFSLCAVICGFKFVLFVQQEKGLRFSVPQLCLGLAFVASVLLALGAVLNPLGSRNNTSQLTLVTFRELPNVMWLLPVLVFPFYWGELVASSQPVVGLKQSRIPFLGAAFLIFALTLAVVVVKGLYGSSRDFIYAQICSVTILAGLAGIYFTFQGLRVIISLGRMQESYTATPIQRRTTVLFLLLALCLWGFVVIYACSFAPSLGQTFPNFAAWLYFYSVLGGIALMVIALSLSPQAVKAAGARMGSIISGKDSAAASSAMRSDVQSRQTPDSSRNDVEMGAAKNSDGSIEDQMSETKVAIGV